MLRAFNGGDVEAIVAECDPAVEWEEQSIPGVEPLYRGHDGVRRWAAAVLGVREELGPLQGRLEGAEEIDDMVIASVCFEGEGKVSSGVEGSDARPTWWPPPRAARSCDGRCSWTLADAREAAGAGGVDGVAGERRSLCAAATPRLSRSPMFAERIAPDVEFDFTVVIIPIDRCSGALMLCGASSSREGRWGGTIQFEPERFIDVDDERGARVRSGDRDRTAQAVLAAAARAAHEFTIRDGLLVRFKRVPRPLRRPSKPWGCRSSPPDRRSRWWTFAFVHSGHEYAFGCRGRLLRANGLPRAEAHGRPRWMLTRQW